MYRIAHLLPLLLLVPAVQADTPPPMDRLQLSATASRQVMPDRIQVRLYAQAEGRELPALADEVNRRIRKAVERARREPGVVVQSRGYSTSPIYHDRRLTGWRVRQTILLRASDPSAIGTLLGRLQEDLALEGMTWEISAQLREQVLAGLRRQAVDRFRDKAQALAKAFGYHGYRLVQASVNDGGRQPGPVPLRAMAMQAEGVGPPTLAPGEQTLSVTISGAIRLLQGAGEAGTSPPPPSGSGSDGPGGCCRPRSGGPAT